ncbi:MAG: hypothetical protein WD048_01975 [Chitinophagales bacterium]
MRHEQIYDVPENKKLIIKLPENFGEHKKVLVIIDDSIDEKKSKLNLLKQASKDSNFLQDIEEVENDFNKIDSETL